jgi:hypothetical protein
VIPEVHAGIDTGDPVTMHAIILMVGPALSVVEPNDLKAAHRS